MRTRTTLLTYQEFAIPKNEKTKDWVKNNLCSTDWYVRESNIVIKYQFDFQKQDILYAIESFEVN